ncbi:hypothetical protein G6L16_026725 (plasmid) [Agrobacterium tumefaciens]|uniref:DUF6602 domain-containing protein n=1 Tax=Agrobacterium tumefaciens TaxID=358 RepID=UPI001572A1F8|nr:DUF6602 domain-containing protein [Agrobacterium tumefaciens]NSZ66563.1 hypothetical protein [Agrobacterium tumefaciens]NTA72935.1 hypothetical protein [Agrobacterium tumefaciens]WIE41483.1 hypothetical protein G6L16_026725 [Agrobacterium tumefaciens]
MADENTQGAIDLRGFFQAKAQELLASVEQGKILHATHNIREAGGPLESVVRQTFSGLLPSSFSIGHGYLFDTASNCTPQIDLLISPAQQPFDAENAGRRNLLPVLRSLCNWGNKGIREQYAGSF